MKQAQKWFLAVWIPIFILVSTGIFGAIGRTIVTTKNTDGIVFRTGERTQTIEDILVPFFITVIFSIIMFIIAGLENNKNEKVN